MSRSRDIAAFLGKTEITNTENNALLNTASPTGLDSAQVSSIAASSGLTVYSTLNDLPSSGLTSGDQAFVSSTSRFYISNGSGWYNVALINATPSLTIDPTGTIILATDGVTPIVITLTATDSDNPIAALTYSVESDGNFGGLGTISQDSSVFTITPLSEDSATTGTSILTFKASDGISFGSGTRTITLAFKAQYSNYTTLLVKADTAGTDDQVDASSNSNTITEVGTVTSTALSPYHLGGYSTYFDGSGDNITISDLGMGSGDCTFEFWFYQDVAQSAAYRCMLASSTYASGIPFTIYTYSSNVQVWLSSGGTAEISGAFTTSKWHHIALVRNSGTWTLYIDGTSAGTSTTGGSYDFAATTDWRFGENHSGSYDWQGYIKDARFVNGTAVYTSAFTPPTESLTAITNTVLLACHLPYIADGSSNNNTITVNGNTLTKRFGPYDYEGYTKTDHGGSVYVGGATSYVSTNLPAMNGDWTIEGWFQHTANSGTSSQNRLFGGATNDPMILNTNLTSLNVYIDNNLKIAANAAANTAASLNRWYHMALVRETTGNILKLYINGKLAGSQSGGTYNIDAKDPFGIGSDANSSSYGMTGYVADFRVVNGTAVYTAEFTPPTEPLTEIANTDLLTCTNKNSIWDASASPLGLITVGGTAAASNTERKFTSSSAIVYDGNSDYLEIPANDFFNFGTDDFTMETWVYAVATGNNYPAFMSSVTGWSAGANGHRFDNTGYANKFGFYVNGFSGRAGGNPFMHTTNNFNHDTWYHYAVTRSGSTFRMFIDGVLEDTQTSAGSLNIALGGFRSGWSFDGANGYFNGYIQDMRITRGVARYTATFTPPAAEFTG